MEINSYLLRERINLGNLAAGPIGTAAATVDIVADIGIAQTTAGVVLSLPNPTDTRNGRSVSVANSGSTSFTVNGINIGVGNFSTFEWHNGTWRTHVGLAGSDFWRSGSINGVLPDGVTDTQDAIFHNGQVVVDTGTITDTGLTLAQLKGVTAGDRDGTVELGNAMTAIGVDATGKVRISNSLGVTDSRATDTLPQAYQMGTYEEFKTSSVVGLTAASVGGSIPTYSELHTTRRYGFAGDLSGGPVRQDVDLDDGRQYFRLSINATTWGPWTLESKPASDFNLQDMLHLSGTAKVSLTNEITWAGRLITMTAGNGRNQEPSGYHDINTPAVGLAIPVSDGSTRVVTAATAGQTGLSGGVPLNIWESLWYFVPRGSGNGFVPANFRIQVYSSAATAGLFAPAIDPQGDAGTWVRICSRNGDNSSNEFHWGFGESCGTGAQFGGAGMAAQETSARQMDKTRALIGGYAFRPWNLTNSAVSFGFNGSYIRSISSGGASSDINASGYRDINPPAAGTIIYGVGGLANSAWRATVANDAMNRMGEAYLGEGPSAVTLVADLGTYETLWFAHDVNGGTNVGTWYKTVYWGNFVAPAHWIFVAQRNDGGFVTIFTGEELDRGEFLWAGKREKILSKSRFEITSSGRFDCRFTSNPFFAGTAANGIGTSGSAAGALISWPDNSGMMAAMDSDQGRPYTWINVPSAGYAIPMLDAAGTRTRVVQTISGKRYIPLSQWETLVYIPSQNGISAGTLDRGWFVVNYGDTRHIPANALTIATWSADGAFAGANTNKTRIKMGDGTYIQPGLTFPTAAPVQGDHAHGTTMDDWRDIVVAGQTGPGMTAALPAVVGITGPWGAPYNPQFRVISNQLSPRGSIELRGLFSLNTNVVAVSTVIGFLPGVQVYQTSIVMAQATASSLQDNQPVPIQVRLSNQTINGSSGVAIIAFNSSLNTTINPYFTLAANGNGKAAGTLTWLAFDNIFVPHG